MKQEIQESEDNSQIVGQMLREEIKQALDRKSLKNVMQGLIEVY